MHSLWGTIETIGSLVVLGYFFKLWVVDNVRWHMNPRNREAFRRAHGADRD